MKRQRNHFRLHFHPVGGKCEYTRLRIEGRVPTAIPPCELGRLLRQLYHLGDTAAECVLPADKGTVGWFELWSYVISEVPEHLLQVKFALDESHYPRRKL